MSGESLQLKIVAGTCTSEGNHNSQGVTPKEYIKLHVPLIVLKSNLFLGPYSAPEEVGHHLNFH